MGITQMTKEDLKFAWAEDIDIVVNMFSAVQEAAYFQEQIQ
jgi:hypothetical protein